MRPHFQRRPLAKGFLSRGWHLECLDRHLPKMDPRLRGWRVAMADDVGLHKTDKVFRLCWQRGYAMIPHGGGRTPTATPTPATDLNQHVRREYAALLSAYIIEEMRGGASVPQWRRREPQLQRWPRSCGGDIRSLHRAWMSLQVRSREFAPSK